MIHANNVDDDDDDDDDDGSEASKVKGHPLNWFCLAGCRELG